MATRKKSKGWWSMEMADPPQLTNMQWNLAGLLGIVFLVSAILQIIGFSEFKQWFEDIGFSTGTAGTVAIIIIVAEFWAALSMYKLRLMPWFRGIGVYLGVIVAGFWFIENLRLISDGMAGQASSSGFFGKFLEFSPGWLSLIGISFVMFWVVYCAAMLEKSLTASGSQSR